MASKVNIMQRRTILNEEELKKYHKLVLDFWMYFRESYTRLIESGDDSWHDLIDSMPKFVKEHKDISEYMAERLVIIVAQELQRINRLREEAQIESSGSIRQPEELWRLGLGIIQHG